MFFARRSRAFTLLELVVVVVVLGVLAAIAIPTFSAVIERSRDAATLTSLQALARETQALEAFDRNGWDSSDFTAAGSDLALVPGVFAAGGVLVPDAGAEPTGSTVTYQVSGEGVVFAAESDTGQVCLVGLNFTEVADGSCAPALSSGSSIGAALVTLAAASEVFPASTVTALGVTTAPAGEAAAPAPALQSIGWMWRSYEITDGYHFGSSDPSTDPWGWVELPPGTVVEVKDFTEVSGPHVGQVHDVEVRILDLTDFNSNYCDVISPTAARMGWSNCAKAQAPGTTYGPTIVTSDPSRVVIPDNGHRYVAHVMDYGPLNGVDDYAWHNDFVLDWAPLPAFPEGELFDKQIVATDGRW